MTNPLTLKKSKIFLEKHFSQHLNKQNRFVWVDYIRGIAIFLIVYRHVLIGLKRTGLTIPEYLNTFNMVFFSFRMPLFFILSGLFIGKQIDKFSLQNLIVSKVNLLLYPYFIWAVIQISIQIFTSDYTNSSRTLYDFVYLLYNPRAIDQFWYLPALFNATLFFIFTQQVLNITYTINLIISVVLYFISFYINGFSLISDWMSFYIFFVLGHGISYTFLSPTPKSNKNIFVRIIVMIPIFLGSQYYYLRNPIGSFEFIIISLVGCYFIYLLAILLDNFGIMKFLPVVGFYSLYIYCMHVIISAGIRVFLMRIFHVQSPEFLLFAGILFSIFISIAFFNMASRNKFLKLLFYPPWGSKIMKKN